MSAPPGVKRRGADVTGGGDPDDAGRVRGAHSHALAGHHPSRRLNALPYLTYLLSYLVRELDTWLES